MVITLGEEQSDGSEGGRGRSSPREGAIASLTQPAPPSTPHPGLNGVFEWTGEAGLATTCPRVIPRPGFGGPAALSATHEERADLLFLVTDRMSHATGRRSAILRDGAQRAPLPLL